MKKNVLYTVVLLAIGFGSCGDDDNEQLGPPEGQLVARVGEGLWASTKALATATDDNIRLVAGNDNGDSIVIVINDFVLGDYVVNNLTTTAVPGNIVTFRPAGDLTFTTSYDLPSAGGLVTITELDFPNRVITGTYDVVVARETNSNGDTTVALTNGVFNRVGLVTDTDEPAKDEASATINGVSFQPVIINGVSNASDLVLEFTDDAAKSIIMTIPADIDPGNYPLGGSGATHAAVYSSGSTTFNTSGGTLDVTSHSKGTRIIKGTFSFNAQSGSNTVNITGGSFDVAYR